MEPRAIRSACDDISGTGDLLEKALKLAGLVTTLFDERGFRLVVVGGAAVEFYTEGAYMSGDVDLCREGARPIPPRLEQQTMAALGASGGPRSWLTLGVYVDLLGGLENEARTPIRELQTPNGVVRLVPPELLLVERVLCAVYPAADAGADLCARKLLSACVSGKVAVDWKEVERLARSRSYNVADALARMRREVTDAG